MQIGDIVTCTGHSHRMTLKSISNGIATCNYFIANSDGTYDNQPLHTEDHKMSTLTVEPRQ